MTSETQPPTVKDIYPLSPVQHGVLFHTLSAPDSGIYFEQFSVRLEGPLQADVFRAAWERVVGRHDVLRSALQWEGLEQPLMVVFDRVDLPWVEEDWRDLTGADQDARLQRSLAEQRVAGFDLATAPLLRLGLYRLADSVWQVVWSFHHVVLDGWSSAAVLRDVFTVYAGLCRGEEAKLPPVRQYRDYIGWLQSQDLEAAEGFWRDLLSGVPELTPLGVDRPADGFRGDDEYGRASYALPEGLAARIEEAARSRRVTVNTVFQAAWALLLSRYSGSDDVVFGVTSSGRPTDLPGVENIVGMFINTLPTRVRVPRTQAVGAWLSAFQETENERRLFEFSPLTRVQEWSEVPAGSPLFESILVFENYPTDFSVLDEVHDLRVADLFGIEQTNYPLTLLVELGERPRLDAWFDRTRIDTATAERLLGHLGRLVEQLTGDPDRPVAELDALTGAEQEEFARWDATAEDFGVPECLHEPVARQAARTPDAVAVRCGDVELRYAELDRRANRLAHHLAGHGVTAGRVVGLCLHRSVDLVVAMLGVLKTGGAYLPMDPDQPVERLEFLLRDAGADLVLTQEDLRASLPADTPSLALDADWDTRVASCPDTAPEPSGTPADLAYVMYTSGSTGQPKGVTVEHRGVWNRLVWGQSRYRLDGSDTVLQKTPYTFDVSVWEFFWPLMTGARLVLAPPGAHRDPDHLVRLIRDEEVTTVHFVPSMLRYFLAADGAGTLPSLRRVFCSGEALTPDLRDRFLDLSDAALHNLYGPTEASIDVTFWDCLPEHRGDPVVPIGRPVANTVCRILDPDGRRVPVGVPGELCLGGVQLARGYLGRPELTADRFRTDPYADGRLYHTGDLARWRPDGTIEYLGRNDDQVKIRGQRVEPEEIAAVLREDPLVRHAAVVVEPRSGDGSAEGGEDGVLSAFVEPDLDAATAESPESAPWLRRHVDQWQSLYEQIYADPVVEDDPDFNTAGWLSSYTGAPLPTAEMREWRDRTVDRVLALEPKRVLEIGCGTGILLTRIAPHCAAYHGTDMSATALAYVRERTAGNGLRNVTLEERTATDFSGIAPRSVDVVVLNSVVQYFPDTAYLIEVVRGALDALAPGGSLFVGDVRNLHLLQTLHASVHLARTPGEAPASDVVRRVRHMAGVENELLVDPRFFTWLRTEFPELGRITVSPKEGRYDNELSRFRYDVVLQKAAVPHAPVEARWTDWERAGLTEDALTAMARAGDREVIAVSRIPNARVRGSHDRWRRLLAAPDDATVAEACAGAAGPPVGVEPERVRELGRACGYEVEISWAAGHPDGAFDAVLRAPGRQWADFRPPGGTPTDPAGMANMPVRQELGADLRERLQARLTRGLPAFMVPSALTVLDTMPLTSSGKVDRAALRAARGTELSERPYVAPRDAVELRLTRIWEAVLGTERVGVRDDFFDLGGDSLVAIRLASEVQRAFGVSLGLADQLAARTVEEEADLVRDGADGAPWRSLVPITPGDATPLFCVHPAGGSVLCYGELARRLGRDRPLFGLAPLGLEEGQEADDRIDVMAERYLGELRTVRPHGPYHLAGWSLGGVVALEMASRLADEGEEVALVALIDSVTPGLSDGDVDDADVLAEFFAGAPLDVGYLRTLDPEAAVHAAMEQAAEAGALPPGLDAARLLRMRDVHRRHIAALAAHRAPTYDGHVVLFRAEDTPVTRPAYGWEEFVTGGLEVVDVPGDHQSVLAAPNVQRIAGELAVRIEKSE